MGKIKNKFLLSLCTLFFVSFSLLYLNKNNNYKVSYFDSDMVSNLEEIHNTIGEDYLAYIDYDSSLKRELFVSLDGNELKKDDDFTFKNHYLSISKEIFINSHYELSIELHEVMIPVESISFGKKEINLLVGETYSLDCIVLPSDATNKKVNFVSSNPSAAVIDDLGLITAVADGYSCIIGTSEDGGKVATCKVFTSSKKIPANSVSITPNSISLPVGEETTINAIVSPYNATNQKVYFDCDHGDVALVHQNGKVQAISAGSCTITATTDDGGFTATCLVNVISSYVPTSGISIDEDLIEVDVGDVFSLNYVISPENATIKDVRYDICDSSLLIQNENKSFKALMPGTTSIVITTVDGGFFDTIKVFIRDTSICHYIVGEHNIDLCTPDIYTFVAYLDDETVANVDWELFPSTLGNIDASGKLHLSDFAKMDGGSADVVAYNKSDKRIKSVFSIEIASFSLLSVNGLIRGSAFKINDNISGHLVIPRRYYIIDSFINIVDIPSDGFYSCAFLDSVSIPDSIVSVGKNAFLSCDHLGYFYSNGYSYLGDSLNPFKLVFKYDETISENVSFSRDTRIIPDSFFNKNDFITHVFLPANLYSIGKECFSECDSLSGVYFNVCDKLRVIDDKAFFHDNSLYDFPLIDCCPELSYIGNECFASCYNLSSFEIPSNVSFIGTKTFAFTNIEKIIIDKNNKHFSIFGNKVLIRNGNEGENSDSVMYCLKNVDVKEILFSSSTIKTIEEYAFYNTNNDFLTLVDFSFCKSLVSIGDYAFCGCDGIKLLYFKDCINLKTFGKCSFQKCSSLESVIFPDNSVSSIYEFGDSTFEETAIKEISIPNTVVYIGKHFLYSELPSPKLESVKFWNNINCIGLSTDKNFPIKEVITPFIDDYKKNVKFFSSESYANYSMKFFLSTEEGLLYSPLINERNELVSSLEVCWDRVTNVEKVSIPGEAIYKGHSYSVTGFCKFKDGQTGFEGCTSLKEVAIPTTFKGIAKNAFLSCTNLTYVYLAENLTFIDFGAFSNCKELLFINIPNSVMSIGASAFYNCSNLSSVIFSSLSCQWAVNGGESYFTPTLDISQNAHFLKTLNKDYDLKKVVTEENLC